MPADEYIAAFVYSTIYVFILVTIWKESRKRNLNPYINVFGGLFLSWIMLLLICCGTYPDEKEKVEEEERKKLLSS